MVLESGRPWYSFLINIYMMKNKMMQSMVPSSKYTLGERFIFNNTNLGNINTIIIGHNSLAASLGYSLGDYFGKRFKCTLSRNINTNSFIKNHLSEVNSYSLLKKSHIRYVSNDSENSDTETNSEIVNPDYQVAENWEKVQSSTADYFRFMNTMGQILEATNIESLSNRSKQLALESENSTFVSDEQTIINDRNTINRQSELISQAENSLAEKAQFSNRQQQQIYDNLQPSMTRLKDNRDEAVQERKTLEESLQQLLVNNTEGEETENERNLETTTEQTESSERKRKSDASEEEQAESSKKQITESEVQKSGSIVDDFADPSQEPADYTAGDD